MDFFSWLNSFVLVYHIPLLSRLLGKLRRLLTTCRATLAKRNRHQVEKLAKPVASGDLKGAWSWWCFFLKGKK